MTGRLLLPFILGLLHRLIENLDCCMPVMSLFEAKCLPAKASDAFSFPCLVFISAVPLASSSIIYQPKEVALHVNNILSKMEETL